MQLFDEDWISTARGALVAIGVVDAVGEIDAVVEYTISGRPVGRLSLVVSVLAGAIVDLSIGRSIDPDIAISLSYDDAVAILSGSLTSDAAYMSGALKAEGDYSRWLLDLRPLRSAALEALAPLVAKAHAGSLQVTQISEAD